MPFVPEVSNVRRHTQRSWFVVHAKGLVARKGEGRLILPTDDEVVSLGLNHEAAHRLGSFDETDALVVPIDGRIEPPFELIGLRALAAFVDAELFGVVGRAFHATDWLTNSRFCGRCGTATTLSPTERCAVCPGCGHHTYPRISPAIITLVRRGDEALLASNAKFPGVFYSTLAGFSDIGESLEETVRREVLEEVGVHVHDIRYFGSQPWPFPNSLMIGFTAQWESGEIAIDPAEISDAQWFTIDALPPIPPPLSIARRLIDAWIADVRGMRGT
ncbi:MAG: NAD(+) diphosphatase [Verrucomicrobia bacterium]|nr:NAD(+) diphosphatase [Verrucomicrobiota bacterium]